MDEPVKSLRDHQLATVLEMLHLNREVPKISNFDEEANQDESVSWKVLVYDKFGCDVIAPLLKIGELRENGVTLHLLLHQERQPIPDAPAIYLVEPTPDNIRQICQDLKSGLYDAYHFNFLSAVPRPLLEELAQAAVESDTSHQIIKVVDQYLNFVTLTSNLFSFSQPDVFFTLNNPKAADTEIESLVERIASSLFSVVLTLGEIPIIRCPRGNAAEMVAQKLDQKIRQHISNPRINLFQEVDPVNFQRPVLVLLDRTVDLKTMLSHTWDYQPLVHDVLGMKLNKVVVDIQENGQQKKKTYHLDPKDFFWSKYAAVQFPQVAENVDVELTKYKEEHEKATKLAGNPDPNTQFELVSTDSLKSLVSNLPMMTEKKRVIDMHMNIATNLLKAIKERQIDYFVQFEETLVKQTKATLIEALRDTQKGLPEDKLRTFLAYYLYSDSLTDADLQECEEVLKAAGCNTSALRYLKQVKDIGKMTSFSGGAAEPEQASLLGFGLRSLGNKWTDGVMDNAVQMLKSGVNNLRSILPSDQALPVTRLVDAVMEGKANPEVDQFLYFDPKSSKKTDGRTLPKTKATFQSGIVFTVGGGNFPEYLNLQEYAQKQLIPKNITYGSTDVLTAKQFLSQLTDLGNNY